MRLYGYLLLYMACHLPMLAIVAVFAVTLGTRGVSVDEARRLKLLSGLLMLAIGTLLLLAPDRLSDLTWTIGVFLAAIVVWLVLVALDHRRPGPTRGASTRTMRRSRGGPADSAPAQEDEADEDRARRDDPAGLSTGPDTRQEVPDLSITGSGPPVVKPPDGARRVSRATAVKQTRTSSGTGVARIFADRGNPAPERRWRPGRRDAMTSPAITIDASRVRGRRA